MRVCVFGCTRFPRSYVSVQTSFAVYVSVQTSFARVYVCV